MDLLTPINAAAALFGAVAAGHAVLLVHDSVGEPRFLKPADKPLLNRLKKTRPQVSERARSYWLAALGAQAGHILGLVMLIFLIELAASPLMAWLRVPVLAVAALYSLISWRCFFPLPTLAMALATALLVVGWRF